MPLRNLNDFWQKVAITVVAAFVVSMVAGLLALARWQGQTDERVHTLELHASDVVVHETADEKRARIISVTEPRFEEVLRRLDRIERKLDDQ